MRLTDDELRCRYSLDLDNVIKQRHWELREHAQMSLVARFLNWIVPVIGRWLKRRSDERPTQ